MCQTVWGLLIAFGFLLTKNVENKACVIKHVGAENAKRFGACKGLSRNCGGACGRRDGQTSGYFVNRLSVLENV